MAVKVLMIFLRINWYRRRLSISLSEKCSLNKAEGVALHLRPA